MRGIDTLKELLKRWMETPIQQEISLAKLLGLLVLSYTVIAIYLMNSQQNATSLTYMVNISWGSFIFLVFFYKMPRIIPLIFYMIWSVVISTVYRHVS